MRDPQHNQIPYRLDNLAVQAAEHILSAWADEDEAIIKWVRYGEALNEARKLIPGDKEFGEWVKANVLSQVATREKVNALGQVGQADVHPKTQQAAMWAAANPDEFKEARQRGNPRTIRGIHAKWKEIVAEREAEEEAKRQAEIAAQEQALEGMFSEADPEPASDDQQDDTPPPAAESAEKESLAQGPDPEPTRELDQEPEPHAEARRALRNLTRDALEDDVIGLKEAVAAEKERRAAAEAERDAFKAKFKEATAGDMGRALGNAIRQRDTAKGRLQEELRKNARLQRRVNSLEKEKAARAQEFVAL